MDLIAIVVLTLALLPAVFFGVLEPLRIGLGLLLVTFFPGYVMVAAIFSKRETLDGAERAALSVGTSLALVPLLGLALHFTPWGIRLSTILVILCLWTLALAAVAWRQRQAEPPGERMEVLWETVAEVFQRFRRPQDLVVPAVLTLAILVAIWAMAERIWDPPPRTFTEFYILGAGGMLEDYPTTLEVGEPQEYTIGIANREGETIVYTVRAVLKSEEVGSVGPRRLADGESWEGLIRVIPTQEARDEKLELRLNRIRGGRPLETVHIFVDVFASQGQ
jgi:uncharacterized membrane protein